MMVKITFSDTVSGRSAAILATDAARRRLIAQLLEAPRDGRSVSPLETPLHVAGVAGRRSGR